MRHVESNAIRSAVEVWSMSSAGVDKWTKHTVAKDLTIGGLGATPVGSPAQIVDEMQRWIDEADVDGSNMPCAIFPSSFEDIVNLLVPELRSRGMFWSEYAVPGGTHRENFYQRRDQTGPLPEHVAAKYRCKAGIDKEQHPIPE